MADNQTTENANMPSKEEAKEFEKTLLSSLSEAENGNDEMKKVFFDATP